ncbi:hypothetical protein BDN70DRAFT_295741 [Pholiota conissans]|uniref:Uncharacterized protein n=1 Tax=Pholiota conissans TaxID=109636 RepID=A0A9P6CWP2_9AGAR|nr:hypothetical protein BDN70DRAFT_295741 [Pholiota conissans]
MTRCAFSASVLQKPAVGDTDVRPCIDAYGYSTYRTFSDPCVLLVIPTHSPQSVSAFSFVHWIRAFYVERISRRRLMREVG